MKNDSDYLNVSAVDAAQIGTQVAMVVASIDDANKRRKMEEAIMKMDLASRDKLNNKIASAKSQSEKMALLLNSVAMANNQKAMQRISRERTYVFAGAAIVIAVFITALVMYRRRK